MSHRSPSSPQGAPESVLERCNYLRVGSSSHSRTRTFMSPGIREQILSTVREWGSGRDTLRCLAMATRDSPPDIQSLNLENPAAFADYEVTMMRMFLISATICAVTNKLRATSAEK